MGAIKDGVEVIQDSSADAVAIANVLHYKKLSIAEIRKVFKENGINIRDYNAKS